VWPVGIDTFSSAAAKINSIRAGISKDELRLTYKGFPNFRPGAGRAHARHVTG